MLKTEDELSQIRLEIAVALVNEKKQTELGRELVRGCAEDPHVKRILKFYGVAV